MKTVMALFALLAVAQGANAGFLDSVLEQITANIAAISKLTPANLQNLTNAGLGQVFKTMCPDVALPADALSNLRDSVGRMSDLSRTGPIAKGLTCLSHMTLQQFRDTLLKTIPPPDVANRTAPTQRRRRQTAVAPASVDWRTKGYVTPVKNQGQCGSCWTFSATGAMEGALKKKTSTLPNLSEQNLVDCIRNSSSDGCNGGWMTDAYSYVNKTGGIDTQTSYPYTGTQVACKYAAANSGGKVTSWKYTVANDETDLMNKIASVGPIATAIDASNIQNYKSGVITCPNFTALNHGVLIVGYGANATSGEKYWIVKNSWGTTWGEQGYMRIAKDKSNQCGIATAANYPVA